MTPPPRAPDPFHFGSRFIKRVLADGGTELAEISLTIEDLLHPKPWDRTVHSPLHSRDQRYLVDVLRTRPLGPSVVDVTSNLIIDWGVEGVLNHDPDVAVFVGLREEQNPEAPILHLTFSGGRCLLAIEIVSPETRVNDVTHKLAEYYQAGVPLYVIVDDEGPQKPRAVRGYRHTPSGWESLPLDPAGRLLLQPVGLFLGLREARVRCWDAATGEEVPDYETLVRRLNAAEERARKLNAVERGFAEYQRAREEGEPWESLEQRLRDLEEQLRRLQPPA